MPFYDEQGNELQGTYYDEKGDVVIPGQSSSDGSFITNFAKGLYTGVTRRIPEQIGQAMQFTGIAPEAGKSLADWAREGEPETEKGAFEQAGEMAPLSGFLPALGFGIQMIPHPIAKLVGAGISYGAPLLFGLSQAQSIKEEAEKRGVDPGMAPYATGGIELAGETIANIALGRLLGPLAGAAKEGAKTLARTAIPTIGRMAKEMAVRTLPTEIMTEMGQNWGEAMVEKHMGVRPEADPTQEALGAIAPTAIMTIATGGLGVGITQTHGRHMMKTLGDPEANVKDRLGYASGIEKMIRDDYKDPDLADMWAKYALDKIEKKQSIDPNLVMDKEGLQVQQLQEELAGELGVDLGEPVEFEEHGAQVETPTGAPIAAAPSEEAPIPDYTAQETGRQFVEPDIRQEIFDALSQNMTVPQNMLDEYIRRGGVIPENRVDLANQYPDATFEREQREPEAPSPLIGKKVTWTDPTGVVLRGNVREVDSQRNTATIDLDRGYGGKDRTIVQSLDILKQVQPEPLSSVRRRIEQYKVAKQRREEAERAAAATPDLTGEVQETLPDFWQQVDQGQTQEEKWDIAARLAMRFPNARAFADALGDQGDNAVWNEKMGATAQQFYNTFQQTEGEKARQYREAANNERMARAVEEGEFIAEEETSGLPNVGDTIEYESGYPPRTIRGEVTRLQQDPVTGQQVPIIRTAAGEFPAAEWYDNGRVIQRQETPAAPTAESILERARAMEERTGQGWYEAVKRNLDRGMDLQQASDLLARYEGEGELPAQRALQIEGQQGLPLGNLEQSLKEGETKRLEKEREITEAEAYSKGYRSVEEMEADLRAEEEARKYEKRREREKGFFMGKEEEEAKQRKYEPRAEALPDIALMYDSAEEFEADWAPGAIERNIKANPQLPEYGSSREPRPLQIVNDVIKNILSRWNTNLEAVQKEWTKVIKSRRDAALLNDALIGHKLFVEASWAIPGDFDYIKFWNDVKEGKTFETLLREHFQGRQEQAGLFGEHPAVKAMEQSGKRNWVQTVDEFLKNSKNPKWWKPSDFVPKLENITVGERQQKPENIKPTYKNVDFLPAMFAGTYRADMAKQQSIAAEQPTTLPDFAVRVIKQLPTTLEGYYKNSDPFQGKQVVKTDSVRADVAGLVQEWLQMLGMKTRVMVASVSDIMSSDARRRYQLWGKDRDLIFNYANQMTKEPNVYACSNKVPFGGNDRFILLSDEIIKAWDNNRTVALENLAHEFGHVIQFSELDNLPTDQKMAITEEWNKWHLNMLQNGTVRDFLNATTTSPNLAKYRGVREEHMGLPVTRMKNWQTFLSFDEWYADQVARWMVTNEKPQTANEKFFAKIADMLKRLWTAVDKALFRPAQSVEAWLDKRAQYYQASPRVDAFAGLPLFSRSEDSWRQTMNQEPLIREGDLLNADTEKLVDTYNEHISNQFDAKDWHDAHKQESIEFADDRMREDIQEAERRVAPGMTNTLRADRKFWRNLKEMIYKYGIMKKNDLGKIESTLANPFMLGLRYPEVKAAVDIQIGRDEGRNQIAHDFMKMSNTFFRLKGSTLKNVEKALIEGDRELRQRISDLSQGTDEEKALAREIKDLNGYTDNELMDRFGLNAEGIAAYRQVRHTLDTLHQRWLDQIKDRSLSTYRNQTWYALLKQMWGEDLNNDELSHIQKKLGAVYTMWDKSLRAAKIPLANLLKTPETLEGIRINMENIWMKALNDVSSNQDLTEEQADKIIDGAVKRMIKLRDKTASELNDTQIKAMVGEYKRQYKKAKEAIQSLRDDMSIVLGMGQGMTEPEINKELRGLIQAYAKTKPHMQELRNIRNQLKEWVAYFPRERDDTKLHYIAVKQPIKNEDGEVVEERTLYLNYFNIGAIGGEKLKKEAEKIIKDQGLTDAYVDIGRNVKEADATFFRVSDMNTQRIINNAIEQAYHEGKFGEKQGDKIKRILLHAISDQLNTRGFGRHKLGRTIAFDEDGKLITILGYKETDLQDVMKNYITGYAGMETKQSAAMQFTELLADVAKEQPGIRNYIYEYAQEQLRNQERIDKWNGTLRGAAFVWYLGGNFKSAFVQLTQNYITGIPILAQSVRQINKGLGKKAGFLEAERRYHAAMKDLATKNLTEKERAFLDDAISKGVTMDQYISEITGRIGNSFGAGINRGIKALSYFFSQAEIFNRKSAALAMYRLLKENDYDFGANGHSFDSKGGKAVETYVNRTHYLMGKANIPSAAWGAGTLSQGVRAAYTFRSFTHNYLLSMLPQYGGDARTALHSLAYVALLGGMMSLPWLKDIFDWWSKRTGEDILGGVRKELRKYGGKTMEAFGMNGLVGLALGDISGSLGIGVPFMGEPTDTLYGVWGGVVRKGTRGAEAISHGDWYRGAENIAPEAMSNIMKSMRMSEFGRDILGMEGFATTAKGRPIFGEDGRPVSMDKADAFRRMIGFQPREYSEKMERHAAMKNTEAYFENKRRDLAETYRIAALRGDTKGKAKVAKEVQEFNKQRRERGVETLVAPARLSNIIQSARMMARGKEKKEVRYKRQLEAQ